MERKVCSKSSVKSKLSRQPWTIGPNASSLGQRFQLQVMKSIDGPLTQETIQYSWKELSLSVL